MDCLQIQGSTNSSVVGCDVAMLKISTSSSSFRRSTAGHKLGDECVKGANDAKLYYTHGVVNFGIAVRAEHCYYFYFFSWIYSGML